MPIYPEVNSKLFALRASRIHLLGEIIPSAK
jgi:hypothetical protein